METVLVNRASQRSIAIRDARTRALVTAVELFSPSNKRPGGGREEYLLRRETLLEGGANLIELDLLRHGARLPVRGTLPEAAYFAFVSRADRVPLAGVWAVRLDQPLPMLPVPLQPEDADERLELQPAFAETYDAYGFDLELDYTRPPETPLTSEQQRWCDDVLTSRGLRAG